MLWFIEFIKSVKEKRSNVRLAKHFIAFPEQAQLLDYIYHMTLKVLRNCDFWHENAKVLPYIYMAKQHCYGCHYVMLLNMYSKTCVKWLLKKRQKDLYDKW